MSDEVFPQAQEETTGTDKSQVLLVVLVVLAVVASVIMLFSHSDAAMKIAVLAALWAAFIGLFLVAKYRRIAADERAHLEQQRVAFEAELRAEQAELAQAKAVEASAQDTELLQEIRSQLSELREQLEELSGRSLGFEPATLTAEASRIRELEAVTEQAVHEQEAGGSAHTHPITAETEAIVLPAEKPATSDRQEPKMAAEQPARSGAERFSTDTFAAVKLGAPEPVEVPEESPKRAVADKPAENSVVETSVKREAPVEHESHGRRRRDEKQDSISVAELLANLKKNS